jgi:peptidoglycan/LPS O-acetylase OafA/YrhL
MKSPHVYRPDIDGLRAVAVLAVMIYHLGKIARGGFVGVDVFFVISGFLITSIILEDMANGQFTLANFYERRIRRILPALIACLVGTTIAAYFALYPAEFVALENGILAAAFFLANQFYANATGYFRPAAGTMPLIHTWSLAVEEQFYLLFPLALLLLARWSRTVAIWVLGIAALASFGWCEYLTRTQSNGAYYFLATRGWELILGSLLAMGAVPEVKSKGVREVLSFLGFAAILFAAFRFNKNTPFPGYWTLLPCLGAAAIIHLGRQQDTFVARLLSTRALVGLGLISYSLYLWHLPIITFYHLEVATQAPYWAQGVLAAASLAAAYLSWRYIEQPFRKKRVAGERRQLFTTAALSVGAVAAMATIIILGDGWKDRYPPEVRELAAFKYDPTVAFRDGDCFFSRRATTHSQFAQSHCLAMSPEKKNVLIVGDSHAAHLWEGLSKTFPDVNFLQATASGCSPSLIHGGSRRCSETMKAVFTDFLPGKQLDAVVVAMNWTGSDEQEILGRIEELRPHTSSIYVFGPIQSYSRPLPRLLTIGALHHDPGLVQKALVAKEFKIEADFRAFFADKGVHYVSIIDALCPNGSCITHDEQGVPLQFDRAHLTASGSRLLVRKLANQLNFDDCVTASTTAEGASGNASGAIRPACAR